MNWDYMHLSIAGFLRIAAEKARMLEKLADDGK
jgi:hypothetical protein